MAEYVGYYYALQGKEITLASLSAPGASEEIRMAGCDSIAFAVTVAAIDTNVVLRVEGSLDGTNFFNLATAEETFTYTANGTYGFHYEGILNRARMYFVSEAGGTAATLAIVALVGAHRQ